MDVILAAVGRFGKTAQVCERIVGGRIGWGGRNEILEGREDLNMGESI